MSLNYDALAQMMAETPQAQAALRAKADEFIEYLKIRWPRLQEPTDAQKDFLAKNPGALVDVTPSVNKAGRPIHIVVIRHPGAVAEQANNSFVTKAIKDVS